jgi:hypothetical protein
MQGREGTRDAVRIHTPPRDLCTATLTSMESSMAPLLLTSQQSRSSRVREVARAQPCTMLSRSTSDIGFHAKLHADDAVADNRCVVVLGLTIHQHMQCTTGERALTHIRFASVVCSNNWALRTHKQP